MLPDDAEAVNQLLDACVQDPAFLKQVNAELTNSRYRSDKLTLRMIQLIREAMELDCPISMEKPVGEEEDAEFGDRLPSSSPGPEEEVVGIDRKERIIKALQDTLDPRQAFILIAKFGVDQNEARTLDEVGHMVGLTRERIRQIVTKALKKIREQCPELVTLLAGGERMLEDLRFRNFLSSISVTPVR